MPIDQLLDDVIAKLSGGEVRPGQRRMAQLVEQAIAQNDHAIIEAGTGTGKSLAYLLPAVDCGKRTVVATATKALQDQVLQRDIPLLAKGLNRPVDAALLKGRSNYLCLARYQQQQESAQLSLDGTAAGLSSSTWSKLEEWRDSTETGDRSDAPLDDRQWAGFSVSARECPGASRCNVGDDCFAEKAKRRAMDADIVVTNLHVYGLNVVLRERHGLDITVPEHEVLVVDEAHRLAPTLQQVAGLELTEGRISSLARAMGSILTDVPSSLESSATSLGAALDELVGQRLTSLPEDLANEIDGADASIAEAWGLLKALPQLPDAAQTERLRVSNLAAALRDDLQALRASLAGDVCWVEPAGQAPRLRRVPLDVGPLLTTHCYERHSVILTSATLSIGGRFGVFAHSVGLIPRRESSNDGSQGSVPRPAQAPHTSSEEGDDAGDGRRAQQGGEDGPVSELVDDLDATSALTAVVPSPFDYPSNGLLYCAVHLPEPSAAGYREAAVDEMATLIKASGGRALALFTSWKALNDSADSLTDRLKGVTVLRQGEGSPQRLLDTFRDDETSVLFATASFWQGVDIPGRSLSLLLVDKIPFPRPDEPLVAARREEALARRMDPFRAVDIPDAATMLAQGVGRLIRHTTDRGVVAILDRRIATKRYGSVLVRSMPPFRRTKDRAEAVAFLERIVAQ